MALPSAVKGGLRPSLLITWYRDDSTDPEPLTGATLTGYIRRGRTGTAATAITGTLTVTDGPNGVFRWDLSAADVATSGTHYVQFTATFGSGQTPAKTFTEEWHVARSLA